MERVFMNRGLLFVTGLLLLQGSIGAWGGTYRAQIDQEASKASSLPTNFPYSNEQGWYVEENYLLWRPSLEDLDFASKFSLSLNGSNPFIIDVPVSIKKFNYGWDSGVRMGVGRFLPNHDQWDISAYMTFFYSDVDGKGKVASLGTFSAAAGLSFLFPDFDPSLGLADHVSASWRLNYFVWDLMLGRAFQVTPKVALHPYFGLRAALIDQDYRAKTSLNFKLSSSVSLTGNGRISLDNDFWGVGPRLGTHFNYTFKGHWSFLGNLAASLLYGHLKVVENDRAFLRASTATLGLSATSSSHAKDSKNVIRTNLEGSLGIGWEHWFRNNTVRFAPAIYYEGGVWFNMNNFFEPETSFTEQHGSLGYMGLTFNFQVDF